MTRINSTARHRISFRRPLHDRIRAWIRSYRISSNDGEQAEDGGRSLEKITPRQPTRFRFHERDFALVRAAWFYLEAASSPSTGLSSPRILRAWKNYLRGRHTLHALLRKNGWMDSVRWGMVVERSKTNRTFLASVEESDYSEQMRKEEFERQPSN